MKRVRSSPELPSSEGSTPSAIDLWASTSPPDAWLAFQQLRSEWNGVIREKGGVWTTLSGVPAFPLTALRGVLGIQSSLSLDVELRSLSLISAGTQRIRVCSLGGEKAIMSHTDILQYCASNTSTQTPLAHISFYLYLLDTFNGPTIAGTDLLLTYTRWTLVWVKKERTIAPTLETLQRALLHDGLLVRVAQRLGDVAFGVPKCGRLVSALQEGRNALKKKLKKAAPQGGISRNTLLTGRSLSTSSASSIGLSTALLLRDAIGRGTAVCIETATGAIVRGKESG